MAPWPAWDGQDFSTCRCSIKTRGQDDHRSHLARRGPGSATAATSSGSATTCSLGAVNALDRRGRAATTCSAGGRVSARSPRSRALPRAAELRWVIVGDPNYGEGSSREHAALSPRLLGGAAVIARSFARIHESNLKKQGLLALTFADPADYDRIRADDRVSLLGLSASSPGPTGGVPAATRTARPRRSASGTRTAPRSSRGSAPARRSPRGRLLQRGALSLPRDESATRRRPARSPSAWSRP